MQYAVIKERQMMAPSRLLASTVILLASSLCKAEQKPPAGVEKNAANTNVVFFVRDQSGSTQNIPITIITPNGASISKPITKAYSVPGHLPPLCGSAGNASFNLSANWYIWYSGRSCPYPTTVYEAGSMGVEAGKCLAIEVSNLWACPLAEKEAK
jgi:hypothetical protein